MGEPALVYVGGTFDLFHPGHVNFLRACAQHGPVVVSLNTDEFAARYKRRPMMSLAERFEVVRACRYVDTVIVNSGDEDSKPAVLQAKPRWIAHGDDWTGDALMEQMGLSHEFLQEHGISMLYLPYTQGVSTSDLICRLSQQSLSPMNEKTCCGASSGCCATRQDPPTKPLPSSPRFPWPV